MSVGAVALALTTVATGLTVAGATPASSSDSSPKSVTPAASDFKLVLKNPNGRYLAYNDYGNYSEHSSEASAIAGASPLRVTMNANNTFYLYSINAKYWLNMWMVGDGQGGLYGTPFLKRDSGAGEMSLRADGTIYINGHQGRGTLGSVGGGRSGYGAQYGIGLTSPGWKAVGDLSPISPVPPVRQIAATVTSINHVAKSAVISGTATPGARIEVGGASTTANSSGAFSVTVTGLAVGENRLTIVQKVGGTQVGNSFPITVTVVSGGTIVPVPQPGVELTRGEMTIVPFVVQNNETRTNMVGTVTLTAPTGTTFAPGQTKATAQFRTGTTGAWRPYAPLDLATPVYSDNNTKLRLSLNTNGGNMIAGEQYRYNAYVSTPTAAASGNSQVAYTYEGTSSKGTYRAVGGTPTTITANEQLWTARLVTVDNVAKTALVAGNATPGATVTIGDFTTTATAAGNWFIVVEGLKVGDNTLVAVQTLRGQQIGDPITLTARITDTSTVVPVPQPAVELGRGLATPVPFVVQLNGARGVATGALTVTAPTGTTFSDGQTSVRGYYRNSAGGQWLGVGPDMYLTGGIRSADGTQMTFTYGPTSGTHTDGQQWRWDLMVDTPATAAAGTSQMNYDLTGTSPENSYRAQSSTPTTIAASEQLWTARLVAVNQAPRTALVAGDATPGATVTIGDFTTTATAAGHWFILVEGLKVGDNTLVAVQTVDGRQVGDPITLTATINETSTTLGAHAVVVTSEADDWFTEGTNGTVTITTQTASGPTGARVAPGGSLSWTTTLPEGYEAGDLPPRETVDGWTTQYVASTDSGGRQTVEVKITNARTANADYTATGDVTFPIVATSKPTADATVTTVFTPPAGYTTTAPEASGTAKAPHALTATVATQNDIAKTVVVTGTGTPGQQVTAGGVTETIRPDGSYQITAPFTGTGTIELTVTQEIGGRDHDSVTVEFTSTTEGTLIGVQQPRVNLPRNTTTKIPIVVQNNAARENATGTVTFTAPKDTIFQPGLQISGEWRLGTTGGWASDTSLDLTDGVISEDGKTATFQIPARSRPATEQVRYLVEVFTSRTAPAGNRQLDYTYEGTSSIGDFKATGSTIGRVAAIDPSAIRE